MFDGTLKFDTAIDKTGFKLGLSSLGGIAKAGMAAVTTAVGAAASAVTALGGYAVGVGKKFESGMSQIGATLGYSVEQLQDETSEAHENMEKLTAKAEEMGRKTAFSASQAAEGLNILAMSGYDASTSVDMIENTLNLAAAGGISLAQSASYISGSMKGFVAEAANFANATEASAYYSDMIAKGATQANTNVSQLGEALSQASAAANSYGQTSAATEVALLRLAEQNVTGTAAATALSAAMKNVYSPMDQAKKVMDELGVSAYNSAGEARDFNQVVNELNSALSEKTAEERAGLEDAIFGIQGKDAFDKMVSTSAEKTQQFYDSLKYTEDGSMGSAALQAETMLDNLEGRITLFQSATEGFGNAIYKNLQEPLKGLVKIGTDYVSELTESLESGDFSALAVSLGDVLGQATAQLSSYIPKLVDMGVSLVQSLVSGISENSGQIAESLVSALSSLAIGGAEIFGNMVRLGCELVLQLANGFAEALPDVLESAVSLAESVVGAISETLPELFTVLTESAPTIFETGMSVINELIGGLTENLPLLVETGIKILSSLAESISANLPYILTAAVELLTTLTVGLLENLPLLLEAVLGIITSLVTWLSENIGMLIDAAVTIIEALVDFIIDSLPMLIDACLEIITQLVKGLIQYSPKILEAGIKILLKLIEGLISAIPQLFAAVPKIISAIWDAVTETDWLSLGKNILLGIADGLSNGLSAIWGTITDVCESIWNKFTDFFGIHSPSTLFRDELGKFMLPGMVIGVESTENTAAEDINSSLSDMTTKIEPPLLPMPEIPVPDTETLKADVPPIDIELSKPEINVPEAETLKLDVPPIDVELPKPEINVPEVEIPKPNIKPINADVPETDDNDKPTDIPKYRPPKAERDAIEEISVISFDKESLRALESARAVMNTGFSQPSPTSEITNNYSYSTVNQNAGTVGSQNITIPVSLVMDGKVIADGVADIVLDEVDKQQGVTVQMKKRGVAR